MAVKLHPTAVVDRNAEIESGVEVGPYCIVEGGTRLGEGTLLKAHVVVHALTHLGKACIVHPFAVLGGAPQAKRHRGGSCGTRIGDGNEIREHVTIHGGTEGRFTTVGDGNLLMVASHLAHDVALGSHCTLANGVQLAGHVVVEDHATFGGLAAVAQFVRIGEGAFVAGGAMCERDVPPFVIVQGDRARVRALNVVGLQRRGVDEASIARITAAYRKLFASHRTLSEALIEVDCTDPRVAQLVAALSR